MNTDSRNQVLALVGMAALLPLTIYATSGTARLAATPDLRWARLVETGEDHIAPRDLARRMLAGDASLVLVDVRPAPEYAAGHLPGAISMSLPELLGEPGKKLYADPAKELVIYSNGATHPGQAWVELTQRGLRKVRVLDGGYDAFKAEVLTPASLKGVAPESQPKGAASEFAIVRAFFLQGPSAKVEGAGRFATDPETLTTPTVVSTQWVAKNLGKLKLVDVRESAADHEAWHLPGALHLPQQKLRIKAGDRDLMLQGADELAAKFGEFGLAADDAIVLYAEDKVQDATLVALAFARVGHERIAILEGGILRWAADRLPLSDRPAKPAPTKYTPRSGADSFTIAVDDLAKLVREGTTKVLDVRPPEFFRGEKSTEKRAGHIPGAVNRFFGKDFVKGESGTFFRPKSELEAEFGALGLNPETPVTVSCRTGHTASESFFVLRYLLGFRNVRWFNGSWTEWAAREDLPLEKGEARK